MKTFLYRKQGSSIILHLKLMNSIFKVFSLIFLLDIIHIHIDQDQD